MNTPETDSPTGAPPATETPVDLSNSGQSEPANLFREVHDRFDQLEAKFDSKIREDAAREAIVERLHVELQQYKSDLLLQVLRPVLLDLIAMHDDIGKAIKTAGAETSEGTSELNQWLDRFRTDVEDALYRQGIELYVTPGDVFDPRRQQAVKTLPAQTPELEGRIAERLRPGFSRGERILRPERVIVYTKPLTPSHTQT